MGLVGSITSRYGFLESWAYDRFLAPVALDLVRRSGPEPWLGAPRGASLLDVGCGGGHLLAEVSRARPDLELTGVDLSESQLGHARARVPRARLLCGSALALPVGDESMDVVVSSGSLKHWPDRAAGLGECVRALKGGGTLLVIEFDRGSSDGELGDLLSRWHTPGVLRGRVARRLRRKLFEKSLEPGELRELAEELPLDDVACSHVAGTPLLRLDARRS